MSHERKLFLVVLAWGVNYLILPFGVSWFGSGVFTLLRFGLTLPALFLLLWRKNDLVIDVCDIPVLCCIGMIGTTGYQTAFAAAVQLTSTANAAILFSLSPMFSMILSWLVGRDNPTVVNWCGALLAFAGGVLLVRGSGREFSFDGNYATGDALMLVAALLWALAAFISEDPLKKYGGLKVTAWSLPAGVIGLLLISWDGLTTVSFGAAPISAWLSLLFSILGATVIGVVFFYDAIPYLGARKVMVYMYLVPVIAIFSSCIIFKAGLTIPQITGIGMSLLGIYLVRYRPLAENVNEAFQDHLIGKPSVSGDRRV